VTARTGSLFAAACALLPIAALTVSSCSLGEGSGAIHGEINVANCWSGPFDLKPDFFGGVPFRDRAPDGTIRDAFQIRIQNGGDFQNFSDGVSILIDDVHAVRGDGKPSLYGKELAVSLPPSVTPPGVPVTPDPNPSMVHMALYLQRTCRTQTVALHAMGSVTLNADGSCKAPALGDAPATIDCGATSTPLTTSDGGVSTTDAGAGDASSADGAAGTSLPVGHSTITFTHLFNGEPTERDAAERRNTASFRVYLADPREICPGGLGPPPRCRGYLEGSFDFYFERGRPAQPFP
jgi:hypothetical protein